MDIKIMEQKTTNLIEAYGGDMQKALESVKDMLKKDSLIQLLNDEPLTKAQQLQTRMLRAVATEIETRISDNNPNRTPIQESISAMWAKSKQIEMDNPSI